MFLHDEEGNDHLIKDTKAKHKTNADLSALYVLGK